MPQGPPPEAAEYPVLDENELAQATRVHPRKKSAREQRFPCGSCGADVRYSPGAAAMKCPYCGFENLIPQSAEEVQELDYHEYLAKLAEEHPGQVSETVKCPNCAAETTPDPKLTSLACPFCGAAIVATSLRANPIIRPRAILPFALDRTQARQVYRGWLEGLWFAPDTLRRQTLTDDRFVGVYLPYWTYDCRATSWYQGQRGDDYYVTRTYTDSNGQRRTRQERRTRWTRVSGVVWNRFDDILVRGSRSLPPGTLETLEPWDLKALMPYDDQYLSGFRSERYQIGLTEGFEQAQGLMQPVISNSVRSDIGGDHQRISEVRSQYDNVTFKHILLPVWLSAYRYHDRTFRFMVNARTGEVQGERPWSVWKIIGVAAVVLLIILILILLSSLL